MKALVATLLLAALASLPAPQANAAGVPTVPCVSLLVDPCGTQLGLCPDGKVGAGVGGKAECFSDAIAFCSDGQVGVARYCVSEPALGGCSDGTTGLMIGAKSYCVDPGADPCTMVTAAVCDVGGVVNKGPTCPDSDRDYGFGGTRDTCYYACGPGEFLYIKVIAQDKDADAGGWTTCGDATANCPRTPVTCDGVSNGLTDKADHDMACNGRSYEAWDSEITVACVSVGASLVCKVTGYNCGTSGAISAMGQACSVNSAAPIGLVAGFLDGLPEEIGRA